MAWSLNEGAGHPLALVRSVIGCGCQPPTPGMTVIGTFQPNALGALSEVAESGPVWKYRLTAPLPAISPGHWLQHRPPALRLPLGRDPSLSPCSSTHRPATHCPASATAGRGGARRQPHGPSVGRAVGSPSGPCSLGHPRCCLHDPPWPQRHPGPGEVTGRALGSGGCFLSL